MDVNKDLDFASSDIMAATMAPASSTSTSTCTNTSTATNDIYNNFHELCRSCGKANVELYDLFQTTNCCNTTSTAATTASPFNTSSTTCYTHLNTSTSIKDSSIGCAKSSLSTPSLLSSTGTFDSVAATAKATAKGQSNMENILQEMQIWHLQIKCNDGLPQRMCAKCTAQFYMIHKFRRKCLKVQTQLRALYEEKQKPTLLNERQQQQEKTENDSRVTIVPTSTPPPPPTTTTSEVEIPPQLNIVNDSINDNYGQEQQALSKKSSVNFATNTWNANDATLLDNVGKTMAKTEANEPTPSLAVAAATLQREENQNFTLLRRNEKKPPMVLNSEKLPSTIKKHTDQTCDNDVAKKTTNRERLGVDQEELLAAHIIFKSPNRNNVKKQDELIQSKDDAVAEEENQAKMPKDCHVVKESVDYAKNSQVNVCSKEELLKLSHINETPEHCMDTCGYTEGVFITKAALKAYTNSQTKSPSAYDSSQCSSTSNSTEASYENEETACQEMQQVSDTVNEIENDDYNNDHNEYHHNDHHHHNQQQDNQKEYLSNSTCCTSTTNSTSPSATLIAKNKQKLVKTEVRLKNFKRSFAKRARRSCRAANKIGHRKKLNAKSPNPRRRALHTFTSPSSSSCKLRSQHEFKRLQDVRTCSSTSLKYQKQLKVKAYQQKNNIATKSTHDNETKTNKYNIMLKGKEEKPETPANIITQEDSSSSCLTLSSSTPTATATSLTSSSSSSATTPDVTDLVKPFKEKHDQTNPYTINENAIKQRRFISATSRQRNDTTTSVEVATCYATSSTNQTTSTSTTMWKTKAAMKANVSDMPMDMNVQQQQQTKRNAHQTTNDIKLKPILLLPYSVQKTTITSTSTATTTTLSSIIDTRSKTLNECQNICSSSSNIIMEDNVTTATKTVLSSKDHKVKDIKNNTELQQQQQQQYFNNLKPEQAEQKQIKHNNNKKVEENHIHGTKDNNRENDDEASEAEITCNSKEIINNLLHTTQQKPLSASTTATTEVTPPAKVGCMKLIIQRKRGARFKCRRKDDIPNNPNPHVSPKRRKCLDKKIDSKLQMESLFSLDLNGDYSKEDKELINSDNSLRNLDEITNDSDVLETIKVTNQLTNKETINGATKEYDNVATTEHNESDSSESRNLVVNVNTENNKELQKSSTENRKQNKLRETANEANEKNKENSIHIKSLRELQQEPLKCKDKDPLYNPRVKILKQEIDEDLETANSLEYREHNLCKNEINDDDEDEDCNDELSCHLQLRKETLISKKELPQMETPKKLIIRVPLAALTQDFKRLHLTLDNDEKHTENDNVENSFSNKETLAQASLENNLKHNDVGDILPYRPVNKSDLHLDIDENKSEFSGCSGQSDLLGFSQSSVSTSPTVDSNQKSIEIVRCSDPNLCKPSSKINDFINDFQNNCIDSSEIDEASELLPQLPTSSQELSDEIRDVEDTLNGILSEMHDKDMCTPRSAAEPDDFFAHSVYSPLTDAPTTPAQSFYAESPCTVNGNPMSVSPFIQQNMDYNAMTPQSNHSSMGHNSHMSSYAGSTSNANIFSEHFPTYKDCFAEESNQSELIGFQNDIPCFENIDLPNPLTLSGSIPSNDPIPKDNVNDEVPPNREELQTDTKLDGNIVEYVDLCDYQEPAEKYTTPETSSPELPANTATPELSTHLQQYTPASYQQTSNNSLTTSTPHSHYIVTNTAQGPILIANPQVNTGQQQQLDNAFTPHANNLQFVTLGQALEANNTLQQTAHIVNNPATELNWSAQANTNANVFTQPQQQQPVITTANAGTTTYFINAGGEVYHASIPTPSIQTPGLNTLIVPPPVATQPHTVAFNKPTTIDANENYLQTLQQYTHQHHHHHQQQQQQEQTQLQSSQTSQYIMVLNNMGTTPQYYATTQANLTNQPTATTTAMATPTVLFHQSAVQSPHTPNQNPMLQTTPEIATPAPSPTPVTKTLTPPPILPLPDPVKQQSIHQRINQQLQLQIKQRQLQLLHPRSPNCTQKINLICRFCHKRPKFTNNVDYSNHIINMHPAEKPYNCPHCPMHFVKRFERQTHVAQFHGSRYQCAQCGLSFCAQRTLDFHLQKYHANLGRSQQETTSSSSSVDQQQNSTSSSSSSTATSTYRLLQHNQQQRLVRVEDVHVQVTDENKNKRSIDLQLDDTDDINASQFNNEVENLPALGTQDQQTRKLCCPDCNGNNDDCCASNKHHDRNNQPISQQQQYTGNESVNNHHITIASPEQTEPDSTTTLRHFRKRQLCELSPFSMFSSSSSSSSSASYNSSSTTLNNNSQHDNVVAGGGVDGSSCGEQIVVERALRGSHNCLLCEESFTNEIALRKHHHLAHGTQATMAFVCSVCKRGFRMRNALQRHMETHDAEGRPYECNICQVRFPRPSQLTLHKLTVHKFEQPHSCEECGKQFGTESAMKAHAKTHEAATTQLSSCAYMDTTATTSTTSNEQNVNLQLSHPVKLQQQILPQT